MSATADLQAEELQLDAFVGEALGEAPPADLAARIRARLVAAARTQGHRRRVLAAVLLVAAGMAAVMAVAWQQGRGTDTGQRTEAAPQDDNSAQAVEGAVVRRINVTPPESEIAAVIVTTLKTQVGRPFRNAVMAEDIAALWSTLKVRAGYVAELTAGGVQVTIDIKRESPGQDKLEEEVDRLVRDLEAEARRGRALRELQRLGVATLPRLRTALDAERQRGRAEVVAVLEEAVLLVGRVEFKARWGLPAGEVTIAADYSKNCVVMFDAAGKVLRRIDELFGVWDAEWTAAGTLLVCEFSNSRVVEVDADGKVLWEYKEGLRSPNSATRLPNGNTLIANTFRQEVIEVRKDGMVVWRFTDGIRPFDAERLANGNTLIAGMLKDRVVEVDPAGKMVWEVRGMASAYDADRLPNGNTLITMRVTNCVVEVDRDGKEVWRLDKLNTPSDADRLPNGNTLVAENSGLREFDRDGNVVWAAPMTWAVEVNRY